MEKVHYGGEDPHWAVVPMKKKNSDLKCQKGLGDLPHDNTSLFFWLDDCYFRLWTIGRQVNSRLVDALEPWSLYKLMIVG